MPLAAVNLIVETSVALMVVVALLERRLKPRVPGWQFVLSFALWTTLCGIASGDGVYKSVLYFRMLVYAYLVLWATWHASLTGWEIYRLNRLILALWGLQVGASLFHVFVLRERVEAHVGTLGSTGGGPATVFPLFAMGYLMATYFYHRRSLWWIVFTISVGAVGYASGKRAVYFFMPPLYMGIVLSYCIMERSRAAVKHASFAVLGFLMAIPLLLFGMSRSNQIAIGDESATALEQVLYAIDAARHYEKAEGDYSYTTGRLGSSQRVLQTMLAGTLQRSLWGLGPASLTGPKRAKDILNVGYGIAGWTRDTVSIGLPGMLLQIAFYAYLWLRLIRQQAWPGRNVRALQFGTHIAFCVFVFMYFFYCDAFVMAGWFTYVHFYFLALVLSPNHQTTLWSLGTERCPSWRGHSCVRRGGPS